MRFWSLFLLFLCLTFSVNASVFDAKEFALPNGLHLVVIENNKAPLVAQYLCYHVGRIDEPKGKSGVAHLLEHMMFKGSALSFSTKIDSMGGSDNAFTTNDMTCYHQSFSSEHLEEVMSMEAERMHNVSFSDAEFAEEKKVVMQERIDRTESRPEGAFQENSLRIFYEDTPYAIPTIGYMDEIKSLTAEDVRLFYETWYIPSNAVLVISGDVSASHVKEIADKYYGGIRKKDYHLSRLKPLKDYALRRYSQTFLMQHVNVSRPQLFIRFHAPSFFSENVNKKNIYALDVFAESIGGSIVGKLYQKLVVDEKVLVSVSASYNPYSRLAGEFVVSASPVKGYDREKIVSRILSILAEDITEKEIMRVRERMKIDMIYLVEKPLSGAQVVAPLLVNGLPLAEIEDYVENINSFSVAELNAYKKQILQYPFIGWLEPND